MFCGKCGAENDNGATFCVKCGAAINSEQMEPDNNVTDVKAKKKDRKVGIIVAVVIIAVALIVIFTLFGGRGYKSTVKKYFDASMNADAKAIINLIPEEVMKKALEDEGYDKDEMNLFIEEWEKELEKAMDKIDDSVGEGWKMNYEITDTEDITGKDLKEIKEDYEDYDIEISEAKKVEVEVTVKVKDKENSKTAKLYLIKVGRIWYLDVENMGSIF